VDTVLVARAPDAFRGAYSISPVPRSFERRGLDGNYWLINEHHGRLPAVLIGDAGATTPAAVIIPLDAAFAARSDAALRLWRIAAGRQRSRPADRLTRQRRHRLRLTLRVLDGRLAGESYRVIARSLFGDASIPSGTVWKTHEFRDRTIRLARDGLELMQGGYLDLMGYPRPERK